MKQLFTLTLALLLNITCFAQKAEYMKAVAKYKNITSLTATATRTIHKASSADKSVTGTLTVKKPSNVSIVNGKDALIMEGTAFTMKKGALKAKTDASTDSRYKTFHDVLESIFNGGATDISKNSDVKLTKSGSNVIITITPSSTKKMTFSSYIVTIDGKNQELHSIRMTQKGGAYTEYVFSNYKLK